MSKFGWCEPVEQRAVSAEAIVDPNARATARAQLDAIVAKHVYELNRDEVAHVLDQFPVLQKREVKAYGTYATKDLVLDWYDRV